MNEFNIKEVDFYSLDIDKYIDWLIDRYKLYSTIWSVVYFDEMINDLHLRKYLANSHFLVTRSIKLPEKIENAYNEKIQHFEKQKNKYKDLFFYLPFFKSINIDKKELKHKYGGLSTEQLRSTSINSRHLIFWLNEQKESYYIDLIDEINERKKATPLTDVVFYQREKDKILNNFTFEYLPLIIDGKFIFDLDIPTDALRFASEIDKIRVLIYLSEKIQGDTIKHPLTKSIQWNGNINALATVFYALADANIIETSTENIKRLLISNFTDSENKELSKHYLDEIFKVSKGKLNKEVLNEMQPLLSILTKNSPQA